MREKVRRDIFTGPVLTEYHGSGFAASRCPGPCRSASRKRALCISPSLSKICSTLWFLSIPIRAYLSFKLSILRFFRIPCLAYFESLFYSFSQFLILQSLNLSSLIPLLPCLSFIVPLYASLSMCPSSHVAARVSLPPFPNKYLTFRFSYATRVCAFQLSPRFSSASLQARDSISSFPRCQ